MKLQFNFGIVWNPDEKDKNPSVFLDLCPYCERVFLKYFGMAKKERQTQLRKPAAGGYQSTGVYQPSGDRQFYRREESAAPERSGQQ